MSRPSAPISPTQAALVAWLAAAIVNTTLIALTSSAPGSMRVRLVHHAWDVGQFLAMGLFASATTDLWLRARIGRRWVTAVALSLFAGGIGALTLPTDLESFSGRFTGYSTIVMVACIITLAVGVGGAWLVGRWLARPIARWAAVLAGLSAIAANGLVLRLDYPGGHLFLALYGTTLVGAALAGASMPASLVAGSRARVGLLAMACIGAAAAVVLTPPILVAPELLRHSGSVLPPFLGQLRSDEAFASAAVVREEEEWFGPREHLEPIAPNPRRVLPGDGLVILLGIDSLRADVLTRPETAARLPSLVRFRERALDFAVARAPGTQTVYTMTSLFSGTYFSQQYWTEAPFTERGLWPHADEHVRFPELLVNAGIATVSVLGTGVLANQRGCARGFEEELRTQLKSYQTVRAEEVMDLVIQRLEAQDRGPLFLFTHFLDPHIPYDLAGTEGSDFERYIDEIALVDAQLERFVNWLDASPWRDRAAVIVTSDHGEAFGEHECRSHGHTVYEELVRVPLFIRAPGVVPRSVDEPVSLIDLGPTILDLMGQPTPAAFMGQSLVPFLLGENPILTRPIITETRLKQSLVLRDGRKVIVNNRAHTVELYDLTTDPMELDNLAADDDRLAWPHAKLRRFFKVHTFRRDGYRVPYRP